MQQQIVAAAQADQRIVGMLDYGSGSRGQADLWSDLDLAIFIQDAAFEAFSADWKRWAAQFGTLLLAYQGGVGHPWTVYAAQPIPLRVDFAFHRASALEQVITTLLHRPRHQDDMLLYDHSQGRMRAAMQQLLEQVPSIDFAATFEQIAGDFWYYVLYVFSKWRRGEGWLARQSFHYEVMQNLLALLRMESQAFERWNEASAAWNIEQSCTPQRLLQLNTCIPGVGNEVLKQGLVSAATLGYDVCKSIASEHDLDWPQQLAEQTLQILTTSLI